VTPSAEVSAEIPTEADVADQAQPLPTTGSEPEAEDTARHSGAEFLVAEAEQAENAERSEQAMNAEKSEEAAQA
jgi:hypothetical protein